MLCPENNTIPTNQVISPLIFIYCPIYLLLKSHCLPWLPQKLVWLGSPAGWMHVLAGSHELLRRGRFWEKNMGKTWEDLQKWWEFTVQHVPIFFGILGPRISLEYSWFKRPSSAPPSKPKSTQRLRTRPSGHHQQCGYEHHIIRLIYGYLWWIYKWIYIYIWYIISIYILYLVADYIVSPCFTNF